MTDNRNPLHRKMLEAIVCPKTHAVLEYVKNDQELVNRKEGIAYPIKDGVPIMVLSEVRIIDEN